MHLKNIKGGFLSENRQGVMLVLFTAIVSGFSIFINSYGVKEFDSSIFTFIKNALVAVLLIAILIGIGSFSEVKKMKVKHWLQLTAIGLIGGSIPFLLFFRGLQLAQGTTSSFIHKLIFVFVAVLALFFLKEKLTKGFIIGASLLALGNYFMLRPVFSFSMGHLLILAAVIFWAAETVLSKYVLRELSGTVVAAGRMFFGSVFILAFLLATGKVKLLTQLTPVHLGWIAVSSAFLLLYVLCYYNGLKSIKASSAASILAVGAPITTLLFWAFAGKPVSIDQAAGILMIGAGVAMISWFAIKSPFKLPSAEHGRS